MKVENNYIKSGSFLLVYQDELIPKRESWYLGNLYLGTDFFGKVLLKEGFEQLFGKRKGGVKYRRFFEINRRVVNNGKFEKGTAIFKLIIHTPVIYNEENFRLVYDKKLQAFYLYGNRGNIIRRAGDPAFMIEEYIKKYGKEKGKQEYIDLIKAMYKASDIVPKEDMDYGLFKMVYDFSKIEKAIMLAKVNEVKRKRWKRGKYRK